MTYKPTVLNIVSGAFIIWIIVYMIINNSRLSEGEGWGVIALIGLLGFSIILLVLDVILQQFIKNRLVLNFIGVIVVLVAVYLIYFA